MLGITRRSHSWHVSVYGKVFVALAVVECLGIIGLAIASLVVDSNSDVSLKYMDGLAIYAATSFLYFATDSILLENGFQFWCGMVCHGLISLYVVWHNFSHNLGDLYDRFSLYLTISILTLQLTYIVLSPFVHNGFGWRIYKCVGGDLSIQRMYVQAEIFFCLLKLDVLFQLLLVLLSLFFLLHLPLPLAVCAIVALLVIFGESVSGYVGVRRESRFWLVMFGLLSLISPLFFAITIYDMAMQDEHSYPFTTKQLFYVSGSLALPVRAGLLAWSVVVSRNFGKGLAEHVWGRRRRPNHSPRRLLNEEAMPPHEGHDNDDDDDDDEPSPVQLVIEYAKPLCCS